MDSGLILILKTQYAHPEVRSRPRSTCMVAEQVLFYVKKQFEFLEGNNVYFDEEERITIFAVDSFQFYLSNSDAFLKQNETSTC